MARSEVATATGISAAFQAAANADTRYYRAFDAATSVSNPIAIATNLAESYAFVLAGTSGADFRVMKFDIDAHTAGLTNRQATTLDLAAFKTVTDMELIPALGILYCICDDMPYYAHIDSDGKFTSQLQPLETTGDAFTSFKYLTNTPAGNIAVATSTVDAAMYYFRFAYTADGTPSAAVTRIDSTGTAPTAPGKAAVYPVWDFTLQTWQIMMMVPSANNVFAGLLEESPIKRIKWLHAIDLGAPVTAVSAPITEVEYSYNAGTPSYPGQMTFLAGFATPPSTEVGTFAAVTTLTTRGDYEFRVWSATEKPETEQVRALRTL